MMIQTAIPRTPRGWAVRSRLLPSLFALVGFSLMGCMGPVGPEVFAPTEIEIEPESFSLLISVSGRGETIPHAGTSDHPAGTTLTLQAIAGEGYRFLRWSGDVQSDRSLTTILMDSDWSVTAEFVSIAADTLPQFFLPWAQGRERRIGQSNDGTFSHRDRFAWDIPMPIGTPILATAAGRVIDVAGSNARDSSLALEAGQDANFVTIDHGANLQSLYAHLDFLGVIVEPGQRVARGQVIGFSGNTGFSTAPHLHYDVLDTKGVSVATSFADVDGGGGVPVEDDRVTSGNALDVDSLAGFVPSRMPADAFLENNIELLGDLPPAEFFANQTDYTITGRVLDGQSRICAALVDPDDLETVFCELTEVEEDGTFTHTFRIPSSIAGRFFFGVITGDNGAEGLAPRSVLVSPPVILDDLPVALIDPHDDSQIDYQESHALVGLDSFSPAGKPMNYQWAQVSGPPAIIRDPTAPETVFHVEPGVGIDRVSFQLAVFDGTLHSLPAQVDFTLRDPFFVTQIGVTDEICLTIDACPVFDVALPFVSFSKQVIQGWVELVNVETGEELSYSIINPAGEVVRTSDAVAEVEASSLTFWRFVWNTDDLELAPGDWIGRFERNGQVETELPFRVIP